MVDGHPRGQKQIPTSASAKASWTVAPLSEELSASTESRQAPKRMAHFAHSGRWTEAKDKMNVNPE